MIFLLFITFVISFLYLKHVFTYKPPKGMTLFIGAPGSGKTTLCAHFAKVFFKSRKYKDKNIFCNVPILHTKRLDVTSDMGKFLVEDGIVIIDEGGIEFNNRNYMNLDKSVIKFAKLYRHYGITSFLFFSQGMDIDIVFVRLCDRICIVSKSLLPFFIRIKTVRKFVGIDDMTHQLVDQYEFKPLGFHLIFMPTCWKYFDTYETPYLPSKNFLLWNNTNRFKEEAPKAAKPVQSDFISQNTINTMQLHKDLNRSSINFL